MPIWVAKVMHTAVGMFADSVQKSVVAANGESCEQPFSQCKSPVKNVITGDKVTAAGICEGLSASWLRYRAEGKALGDWLCIGTSVDMDQITVAQTIQAVGMNEADQRKLTSTWLATKGFASGISRSNVRINNAKDVADQIVDSNYGGDYRLIALEGSWTAHTMAAHVTANEVLFFDPNFGEFKFNSAAAFSNWFTQQFWSKSQYNLGLSKKYSVSAFNK